jgi:hypothetical protein
VKRPDAGPLLTGTPNDDEKQRTWAEIRRRETKIDDLKAMIQVLESQQRQRDHEEQDRVRPIIDKIHEQIITLQERIAECWHDSQSLLVQYRQKTEGAIVNVQNKVWILEQENLQAISYLAPIRRLPAEVLSEIFIVAIMVHGCSALRLMRVCGSWRWVLMTMPRIWSTIKVRTWTRTDFIEFLLERTRRVTLDIEIDTDSDAELHMSDPIRTYAALAMVAETSKRWRNLSIRSFPKEIDLTTAGVLGTVLAREGSMEALESFRITEACEMNAALRSLIDLARGSKSSKLTTLELSTCDALCHFSTPPSSLFRHLRSFKVDFAETKDPLDILPQFERLEDLHAHHLHLPVYSDTTRLPLVYSLKRLYLRSTSVQWMQGRRFDRLLECNIVWPHLPDTLLTRDRVGLPVCTNFIYDDHLLQPLTAFDLPLIDALVVRNEAWNRPRGSQQLGFIWGPTVPVEKIIRPRILHLDTQCYDQHLISALKVIPGVEELTLGLVRPDALGKKFLSSLLAKRVRENSTNTRAKGHGGASITGSGPAWVVGLCPNIKVLGFKYRRWLREHESDEITPMLREIVDTRARSSVPLQSCKLWPTKYTTDEEVKELVHKF